MLATGQIAAPRFAGHETFPLRYGWLKKAADGITSDPSLFTRADALVRLGVGKNMVRSLRHWAMAPGIVELRPDLAFEVWRDLGA